MRCSLLTYLTTNLQYSPLITSHTHGICCVGHAWSWCLPRMIAVWATPAFRRGPHAWHFPLPATRGHSTFIIKPMFLALLYMYDLIHCIHVLLTYSLCLSHTGWLWLRAFCTGDWHQWRKIQLLIHTPALYYCVFTHCTLYINTSIAIAFICRSEKFPQKLKLLTRDLQLYSLYTG